MMKKLPNRNADRKNLVLYFQVHQPRRLNRFKFFDIGSGRPYFDDALNDEIIDRIARACYLPTNMLLLNLIKKHPGIKVAFSISGLTLEKLDQVAPEVLYSFRALAETGSVEFLCETQYHSLACMIPGNEFEAQVIEHREKLAHYVGITPEVFRNTELIYNDDIARRAASLGFKGVYCDGIEKILGYRSPHHIYTSPETGLPILLRNYRLSDDIAFRFSEQSLTVDQYVSWLKGLPADQTLINIALDYETFGEHKKKASGIFTFLEEVLVRVSKEESLAMRTPSEVIAIETPAGTLSVPVHVSWADRERDLSAWLGNPIQQDAFDTLVSIGKDVERINDPLLLKCWRLLQTSDHFYYMSTKDGDDGNVHAMFSPYPSPYEAFINYMNVLSDFRLIVNRKLNALTEKQKGNPVLT